MKYIGRKSALTAFTAFLIVSAASCVGAQAPEIRKSQLGTVSQMVGDTRIEIVYRRPVARGRALFGSLVRWGRTWSPSADTAAIFSTTKPIEIAGGKLPAGRYSLWAIPDSTMWTVIFSSEVPVFHLAYHAAKDVLRVRVAPRTADRMETLGFCFPMVDADSAELDLHWGRTVVPMPVRTR